ncbi:aminotransferase class V-fold PLP-dependent enzyme, partial [Ureaplasma parvum]
YKQFFPWFKNNKDVVYLDSSATSLKPQVVVDAIVDYYTKYSTNPHNGDSNFAF